MKKVSKTILCLALVAAFVLSLAGCAKMNYVTNGTIGAINEVKSGDWKNGGAGTAAGTATDSTDANASGEEDKAVIDELTPGTYGGIEFKTTEDVVNYYKEAYDYTKTLTAQYNTDEGKKTYYKLLCSETLDITSLLVDGQENKTVSNLAPGIVKNLFHGNAYGLAPSGNKDPNEDFRDDKKFDARTCQLTPEDVLACNVKDNGDGTITITIQPKGAELSFAGQDSQGRFFNVLGDITGTVEQISVLSFAQGTANDNIKVLYQGGTGEVTVNTSTKEITKADYLMKVHIDVTHANVTIIRDKSATVDIDYENVFPASDKYLKGLGITRA